MLGSSDQGSTEQCTISNSSGILIAGQLQTPQIIGTMAAVRVHPLFGTTSGAGAITDKYALLSEASGADIQLTSDAVTYIGDKNTDGSWRYRINGTDLVHERRESSIWVTKQTINA
jgi:hypothetical protein